ncbi:MAG: YHS domain-containing protein [Omnitrophica bacterium]|nr:YHS domain-containing protein [Candidatus Omnitrophota bacterium]
MGNVIWIILGIVFLFWMFKKGGCCGGSRKPMDGGGKEMEHETKDPVCGMTVEKDKAAATSEHMGKTFYFCAAACKEKFDAEPMKYMGKEKDSGGCCH